MRIDTSSSSVAKLLSVKVTTNEIADQARELGDLFTGHPPRSNLSEYYIPLADCHAAV
jgi:hypothetical protein